MAFYTNKCFWTFVGGAAAAIAAQGIAKLPSVRKAAVTVASKAVLAKEGADSAVQSFKDDTEDLCAEARAEAKVKAEAAERAAAIEARIRAEVEAELAAEEAAEEPVAEEPKKTPRRKAAKKADAAE